MIYERCSAAVACMAVQAGMVQAAVQQAAATVVYERCRCVVRQRQRRQAQETGAVRCSAQCYIAA